MKKIFSTMAVVAALFAGYSTYNAQNSNELSDVALANVEALAQDNNPDKGITQCPDYNYVPNHYLETKVEEPVTRTSNKNGEIEVDGIVKGGYESNKQITVIPVSYNCNGEAIGACCDQRLVRVEFRKV